jgi:peptidoglycan/xylan/chitin deacetylase (PgdA/CDA1 family)
VSASRPLRLRRARVAALIGVIAILLGVVLILTSSGGSGSSGTGRTSTASTSGKRTAGAHRRASVAPQRQVPLLSLPSHPIPHTVRVPILTWHRVAVLANEYTKSIPDETVEPSVFASEIQALAAHGFHPISQLQLFDALFHNASLPPKPVLLTMDDGYVDDSRTILPILQAHHFPATFYIITHRFHEPGFLNTTEIRRLDAAGMDIGAHTRTHVPLATLPAAEVTEQVEGSRVDLEHVLGHPVQWFAYPFGSFDSAVVAEVRRAGFVLGVTTAGGTSENSLAPLTMPRIHVGRTASATTVLACTESPVACGGGGG